MIGFSQPTQHDMGHGQINQRLAALGQFFIIFAQTTIVVQPAKGSLNHPTSGQNLKSLDGFVTLDHLPIPAKGLLDPSGKRLTTITTIGPLTFPYFSGHQVKAN
jgi:hypothetical protein